MYKYSLHIGSNWIVKPSPELETELIESCQALKMVDTDKIQNEGTFIRLIFQTK